MGLNNFWTSTLISTELRFYEMFPQYSCICITNPSWKISWKYSWKILLPKRFGPIVIRWWYLLTLSVAQYCPFTLQLDVEADSELRGGRQVLASSNISNLQKSVQNFTERRCNTGKLHFEKTTGYELIRGNPSRLFSDRDGGIIKDCAGRCESDARCMGFNMDYNRNECQAVTTSSENNLFNLRPSSGMSYFEGICLKGKHKGAFINCVFWTIFDHFPSRFHVDKKSTFLG